MIAQRWERPPSPEIVMPKPPPAPLSATSDAAESEVSLPKKEPAPVSSRPDERLTASKRVGSKKPATDADSVAATLNTDDTSGDECQPLIVHMRTVKNADDPNRQNLGLLYVDVEVRRTPLAQRD